MAKTKSTLDKINTVLKNTDKVNTVLDNSNKDSKKAEKPTRKYNVENIEPYNFKNMDKARHREISRNGAIKANETKARKKSLKETLELLLEVKDTETNLTGQEKICIALTKEAESGNTRAFEVLRDTIGQKPTDKQEVTTTVSIESIIKEVNGNEF